MPPTPRKRITVKHKRPNPLFEQWLTEWRDKAIETDSKMQHCFGKALQSLRKYPLPLESGRDCRILQGFGEKLCQMLDKKLRENPSRLSTVTDIADNKNVNNKASTSRTKQKEYVPTWRSGPYAILVTLYERSQEPLYAGYMFKADIIKHGQHVCDKSFTKPDPGSYYTAWSSMKTLLDKDLVTKKSTPAKFSLTDAGVVLARKLYENHVNRNEHVNVADDSIHNINVSKKHTIKTHSNSSSENKSDTDLKCSPSSSSASQVTVSDTEHRMVVECSSSSSITSQDETIIFAPHSFEIILLVDKQETSGCKNPMDDAILSEFLQSSVPYEVRHLKVGDYTWICRQPASPNKELVLPYIIERKRMDDFGSSIKDGRFHEQKFRLKQCGIQNLIYLIESHGSNTHTGLPMATLYQAATNTLLQDGFSVKFTNNLRGTVEYLAAFTSILKDTFNDKTVISCPKQNLMPCTIQDDLVPLMTFYEFNKGASKSRNFKVRELFIRQLLQLKGMSVDKALAIVERYPTPFVLHGAYQESEGNGEKLLASLQHGKLNKKIGPVVSKTIYQLYTMKNFN